MIGYILRHWRGECSLAWAFFINGLAFYLSMVLLLMGLDGFFKAKNAPIVPLLLLVAVGIVWSLVGIAISGIKNLRNSNASMLQKIFAAIALGLVGLNTGHTWLRIDLS